MAEKRSYRLPGAEIEPRRWDALIKASPQGSVFCLYAYMEIVAPGWEAVIVEDGEGWVAVMPILETRRWGLRRLTPPLFTQYWGVCFAPRQFGSYQQQLRHEGALLSEIIPWLKRAHQCVQQFSPQFHYPLPFHWAGYEIKARFTFCLDLAPGEEQLFENLAPEMRRGIRKAKKNGLELREIDTPQTVADLYRANEKEGKAIMPTHPEAWRVLERLCRWLIAEKQGHLIAVENPERGVLAAGGFFHFKGKGYYLFGAQRPDASPSRAMNLLLWEAILKAKTHGAKTFDFEGSMIEGVEAFFRKYGAHPVPYFQIIKNRLPLTLPWKIGSKS